MYILLETHNELASELLFSFSIVKYKVADERILANNIYIYDVKISQLIKSGHIEWIPGRALVNLKKHFPFSVKTLGSQSYAKMEIMKRSSFDSDMETVSFLWRRKIRL